MPERVENLMSGTYEHNKIKTPYAHIIVEGPCEKPYFEIEYYDLEKETTFIGYGSYDLSNVFRWLEENFEVEKPISDVAPVVHGKWIEVTRSVSYGMDKQGNPIYRDRSVYYCSECNRKTVIKEKYCPDCGAKMDLEE